MVRIIYDILPPKYKKPAKRFWSFYSGRVKIGSLVLFLIILLLATTIFYTNLFSPPTPRVKEAHAQISLVQTATGVAQGKTSVSATFAAAVQTGNLLVIICGARDNVTLSGPSGFSTAINESGTPGQAIFYFANMIGGGTTWSCTSSAKTRLGIHMYEYSGIDTVSPLDVTGSAVGCESGAFNGNLQIQSGAVTTTQADELLIAGVVVNENVTFLDSWGSSFIERNDFQNGGPGASRSTYGGAERVVSATGTYSTAATFTGTTTACRGQIAAFKAVPPVGPTFNQSAYRWFDNLDSTDVGAALAAQDTAATLGSAGAAFRLRMLLHIGSAELALSGENFKLQFAERSGTCDTSFTGESYSDVTSATIIAYKDNPTPADGVALTANANDPTHGADTIVNQTYEELNNFTNSVAAIPAGQDGKWDFALLDNSALAETTYCLRGVKSDSTLLNTYTVIPEITTAGVVSATWRELEDTPTAVAIGENIRLRIEVANSGSEALDYDYRLESATKVGAVCGDDESFLAVPVIATTEHFEMTTSTFFVNGDPTTAQLTVPDAFVFVAGKMVEDPSNSSGNITLAFENYTEIEFVFQATANAVAGGSYCFRLTNAGVLLDDYSIFPELQITVP